MPISRRTLLEFSLAGAAGLAVGPVAGASPARATPSAADVLKNDFAATFGRLGYEAVEPLGLITGEAFNGGLRYDESRPDYPAKDILFVQPAARIGDAGGRDLPGVLALFTICGLRRSDPAQPGELFGQMLAFLQERLKLDPERMVFVSTEVFAPYGEQFETVRAGRFVKRSTEEAMSAGDGSGYFAPKDHPAAPAFSTVSIHYPLGEAAGDGLSYPPEGHLEIAEIGLTPLDGGTGEAEVGGFGLERLLMASGQPAPDFEESRQALLRRLEDEASRTGRKLPSGYDLFAAS